MSPKSHMPGTSGFLGVATKAFPLGTVKVEFKLTYPTGITRDEVEKTVAETAAGIFGAIDERDDLGVMK